MLKILNKANGEKVPIKVDAFKLAGNQSVELIEIVLKAGEQVEKHINPLDVVFYVLKGKGELLVDDTSYTLLKGDSIAVEKNVDRAWINHQSEQLVLLVVKAIQM